MPISGYVRKFSSRPSMKVTTRVMSAWKAMNATLDLAHGVEIVGHLNAVARPQSFRQPSEIRRHEIEDAAVLDSPRGALLGRAAVAEKPLEHEPRIVLGGQRSRGGAPRQRVEIDTAVAVLALARQEIEIDAELE
jgi:hypothetical protein